ncbi:MAG: hypothetical protein SFU99_13770 [Saprospiraceae bacterium]|nr:hypothetical protein [Saprospiraceae bacterium]
MSLFPTIHQVDTIATHPEPVLRNLQITQCYYELSQAMTQRTGACANWCTFATWASKQAGQTIRKEDLRRALERLLTPDVRERGMTETTSEETTLWQRLWAVLNPANIIAHSSDAVARGNQKVFAEIGREFARFLESCAQDVHYDVNNITLFCATLKEGDPPNGQAYLQQAFRHYYEAFFETDAQKRAELILMANIKIGFHEQTRLQPEIAEALNASVPEPSVLLPKLLQATFPYRGWLVYIMMLLMRFIGKPMQLDAKINNFITSARKKIRLLLTKNMMVLCFPEGKYLQLAEDLQASFPESLQQVNNPELQLLLQQVDPTFNSVKESGAIDWADLPDRLHYIVDLFRCHQETEDLLKAPFTQEQVKIIKEGIIPSGDL